MVSQFTMDVDSRAWISEVTDQDQEIINIRGATIVDIRWAVIATSAKVATIRAQGVLGPQTSVGVTVLIGHTVPAFAIGKATITCRRRNTGGSIGAHFDELITVDGSEINTTGFAEIR